MVNVNKALKMITSKQYVLMLESNKKDLDRKRKLFLEYVPYQRGILDMLSIDDRVKTIELIDSHNLNLDSLWLNILTNDRKSVDMKHKTILKDIKREG